MHKSFERCSLKFIGGIQIYKRKWQTTFTYQDITHHHQNHHQQRWHHYHYQQLLQLIECDLWIQNTHKLVSKVDVFQLFPDFESGEKSSSRVCGSSRFWQQVRFFVFFWAAGAFFCFFWQQVRFFCFFWQQVRFFCFFWQQVRFFVCFFWQQVRFFWQVRSAKFLQIYARAGGKISENRICSNNTWAEF